MISKTKLTFVTVFIAVLIADFSLASNNISNSLLKLKSSIETSCLYFRDISSEDDIIDDETYCLDPGESITIDNETIENQESSKKCYHICPGSGVACNITIGGKSVSLYKSEGKPNYEEYECD